MTEAIVSYLPWILSGITIWMTLLAGNQHPNAWVWGLVGQALWLVFILASQTWGLIPLNLALWVVYWRNRQLTDSAKAKRLALSSLQLI